MSDFEQLRDRIVRKEVLRHVPVSRTLQKLLWDTLEYIERWDKIMCDVDIITFDINKKYDVVCMAGTNDLEAPAIVVLMDGKDKTEILDDIKRRLDERMIKVEKVDDELFIDSKSNIVKIYLSEEQDEEER